MKLFIHLDTRLEVFDEIPEDGIEVDSHGSFFSIRGNFEKVNSQPNLLENPYYHCSECNGYIAGFPHREQENTIGPLSGRCGSSYHCIRCGYELSFSGYMS